MYYLMSDHNGFFVYEVNLTHSALLQLAWKKSATNLVLPLKN